MKDRGLIPGSDNFTAKFQCTTTGVNNTGPHNIHGVSGSIKSVWHAKEPSLLNDFECSKICSPSPMTVTYEWKFLDLEEQSTEVNHKRGHFIV